MHLYIYICICTNKYHFIGNFDTEHFFVAILTAHLPFQVKGQRAKPLNIAAKIKNLCYSTLFHFSPCLLIRKKAQQVASKICSRSIMSQIKQSWQTYRNITRNQCTKAYFIPQK